MANGFDAIFYLTCLNLFVVLWSIALTNIRRIELRSIGLVCISEIVNLWLAMHKLPSAHACRVGVYFLKSASVQYSTSLPQVRAEVELIDLAPARASSIDSFALPAIRVRVPHFSQLLQRISLTDVEGAAKGVGNSIKRINRLRHVLRVVGLDLVYLLSVTLLELSLIFLWILLVPALA